MGKVERFEDLVAWQKARGLTKAVYQVTRHGAFARDYGLASQLQRASVSIMSSVAEGYDRGGRGEFHQFLSTAKASCAETHSLLSVALDAEYLDQPTFEQLVSRADEDIRIVAGLRSAVERQRDEQRASRSKA